MDCDLKQNPKRKKKTLQLPSKYIENNLKTIFKETKLVSSKQYASEARTKTNLRLLDGFRKEEPLTDETITDSWEVEVQFSSSRVSPIGYKGPKPYMRFLKGSNREIITWPSQFLQRESALFEGLTKNELALMKIDKAAEEFAEWWTNLGIHSTEEEKAANTETIKEMFSIEFDEHVSRALAVIMKEMMCVPKQIAKITSQYHASISATLKRQNKCDAIAEEREMVKLGFNQTLPLDLVFIPPNNQTRERWINIQDVPQQLDDMTVVWNGITNLKSTKDFYSWLRENPEKKMPPFLKTFFENETAESIIYDIEESIERLDVSETFIPVLGGDENSDDVDMKRTAFENM